MTIFRATSPAWGTKACSRPRPCNATKNERGITKAFMHNGYFKRIQDVVHFYNTRFVKTACEDLGLQQATAAEAMANECWPASEFPGTELVLPGLFVQLGLSLDEEAALVAYIRSLEDTHTPTAPSFSTNPNANGGDGNGDGNS